MSHRQGYLKLVILLVLFIALSGCVGITSPASGDGAKTPNAIAGYSGNTVSTGVAAATISGGGRLGFPNRVTGNMGTVGGGAGNEAGGLAAVGGGDSNIASGFRTTIGGGARNIANCDTATVGGGFGNTASGIHATVGGGNVNAATEWNATVGGGAGNVASERHATVGGGTDNTANGLAAVTAGGVYNETSAAYATVGGGVANTADGVGATVGGGSGNEASTDDATVAGGLHNRVTDNYSTVGGGRTNVAGNANDDTADAGYATVGGGNDNAASGSFSAVPGGAANIAAGDYSFAAGRRARVSATHDGTFLYADSNDTDFGSVAANEFAVRATGGVRFVTAVDVAGQASAGVRLSAGSGSWESLSDRNAKTDLAPVDGRAILERVAKLPLTTWRYETQDPAIRHIGPMAQDFRAAFGVGEDDKHISAVDADGVALAAIQGLYQTVQEKDAQIRTQQRRIEALEAEVAVQRGRLAALETRLAAVESSPPQPFSAGLPTDVLVSGGLCLLGLILVQRRWTGDRTRSTS